MGISKKYFGKTDDGREVSLYSLSNKNLMTAEISDFGGTIVKIILPNRNGERVNVVCGFDSLDDYKLSTGYQGAIIGRVSNRIAGGRFTLDGREYTLAQNNRENHLHGGVCGFSHKLWTATLVDGDEPELVLEYFSPDMEEGYPGNLSVCVTYKITEDNALSIHYVAETDKNTPVNLTNHSYFNLGGYAGESILSHTLWLDADTYLPCGAGLIPTGEIKSVLGTPFDFNSAKAIGRDIDSVGGILKNSAIYDTCFNFTHGETKAPMLRGELYCPQSGIRMKIFTNQPCVQLYTGAKNSVALETQKMPDAVNHDNFTNVILKPEEKYDYTTVYKFCIK